MKKLTIILIFFIGASMTLKAQSADLDSMVNLDIAETTLKNALALISEKYRIKFSYSGSKLNTEKMASANFDQISLEDFFRTFFSEYSLKYSIIDDQIVLLPDDQNQSVEIIGTIISKLDKSPMPFVNISLMGRGQILATRKVFEAPEDIGIELISASWRSSNGNRLELVLKLTDNNGMPVIPNLSVIGSHHLLVFHKNFDIRIEVLIKDLRWSDRVNFDLVCVSLNEVIDHLLILDQGEYDEISLNYAYGDPQFYLARNHENNNIEDGQPFAKVSVSGSMSSRTSRTKSFANGRKAFQGCETIWIPKLGIDHKGIARLELKVPNKNMAFYINISGLSKEVIIVNQTTILYLSPINFDKIRRG